MKLAFEDVWLVLFEILAAHRAVLAGGIAVGATGGTGENLSADFSVGLSIAGIDVGDFGAEEVIAQTGVFPQEFPHRLTHEGEVVDLSLEFEEIFGSPGRFVVCAGGIPGDFPDAAILVNIPEVHGN